MTSKMMNEAEITLFGTGDDQLRWKVQITQEENQEAGEVSETKPQEDQNPGEAEESHNTIDEGDVVVTESDVIELQQQKALKKPDEILHCPRCNSMDTKFCYYNNYNVNQPRHFCRNCKRYWTAGMSKAAPSAEPLTRNDALVGLPHLALRRHEDKAKGCIED